MRSYNISLAADTEEYCRNLIQQGEGMRGEFRTSFQKEVIAALIADMQGGIANITEKILLSGVS